MAEHRVTFTPLNKTVTVEAGATLLEAAGKARLSIDSACGGDGICGRCKMLVREGAINAEATALLTRDEIRRGVVLACQTTVESDLVVEIPEETRAGEKIVIDKDAQRFRSERPGIAAREYRHAPIVSKVRLALDPPTLHDNLSDCARVQRAVTQATGIEAMQTGLKILRRIPDLLRENDFAVTALVGQRHGVAEIMDLEGGDTCAANLIAVVDIGTSTIVVHLVDAAAMTTLDAEACFNSQATYGREVTARMIAAERRGADTLQRLLVEDINRLIATLTAKNGVHLKDITAVVCAGNTAMMHFLLGLPTRNIRRSPFIAASVAPPPFRAAEVGIKINPRGLLFAVPGIGAWVGGDITAGILATGLHAGDGIGMLIDIGTNGEIVVGNRDWLMACSASAGPALEGAGVQCGMMAQEGAIERVTLRDGAIECQVIGGGKPDGLCGSGIIDLIAALLAKGVLDRSGALLPGSDPRVQDEQGLLRYVVASRRDALRGREIALRQEDITNVITAKAAIFAAMRILLNRLNLAFDDVERLFIAGGFGSYINLPNAIAIGLLPDLPFAHIHYVGNTSIWGAKLAAFSDEAREELRAIVRRTTCYDLMGAPDYVEEFRRALFLPHTDIHLFPSASQCAPAAKRAE